MRTASLRLGLWFIVAAAAAGCIAPAGTQSASVPIAAARELAPATPVTVEGVVTVDAGTFDDGFALQDASGGIYVTRAQGAALKVGERVRVSGTRVAPNNQAGIEPAAIVTLGAGDPLPIADAQTGAAGPATEGRLIAVRGKVTGDVVADPPWGWKIYVDDGSGPLLVFVATATKIDVRALRTGQRLRVVGFSGRYEQHSELLPRGPGDLAVIAD